MEHMLRFTTAILFVIICCAGTVFAQGLQQVQLSLSNGSYSGITYFLFTESGEIGHDSYDAFHLASLATEYAEIYSRDTLEHRDLSINTLPDSLTDILEIPIYTNATFGDTFTLKVSKLENHPENREFRLKDVVKDSVMVLSPNLEYTLLLNSGIQERFVLSINPGVVNYTAILPGTSGKDGWRFLGSSIKNQTYADFFEDIWTQGAIGSNSPESGSTLFTWSESAQSFTPVTNLTDTITQANGILSYLFEDDDPTTSGIQTGWPKSISNSGIAHFGTIDFPVSYTEGDSAALNGFNLVANPYPTAIDWDAAGWTKTNIQDAIWIWDPNANSGNGAYKSYSNGVGDDISNIAANQAFWVRSSSLNPVLQSESSVQTSEAHLLKEKAKPVFLSVEVKDSVFSDKLYIRFLQEGESNPEDVHVQKLAPLSESFLTISAVEAKQNYSILALVDEEDEYRIPIQINSSSRGSFQIKPTVHGDLVGFEFFIEDELSGMLESVDSGDELEFTPNSESNNFELVIRKRSSVTPIQDLELPTAFGLNQNYPNPFNPSTVISYQLPANSAVDLRVFDMLGREVATLISGQVEAGYHQIQFNASHLASGMYIYRLQAGNQVFTKKLTLIK